MSSVILSERMTENSYDFFAYIFYCFSFIFILSKENI